VHTPLDGADRASRTGGQASSCFQDRALNVERHQRPSGPIRPSTAFTKSDPPLGGLASLRPSSFRAASRPLGGAGRCSAGSPGSGALQTAASASHCFESPCALVIWQQPSLRALQSGHANWAELRQAVNEDLLGQLLGLQTGFRQPGQAPLALHEFVLTDQTLHQLAVSLPIALLSQTPPIFFKLSSIMVVETCPRSLFFGCGAATGGNARPPPRIVGGEKHSPPRTCG